MTTPRSEHTATLLPNGKVLIAGGNTGSSYTGASDIYDPSTGLFTSTGSLVGGRAMHTATFLPNGKVLITGGWCYELLQTAELYDPSTGSFTATGSMTAKRSFQGAALLPNGKVLITGGQGQSGNLSSAELYDPTTGSFTTAGFMTIIRASHTNTLLPNGKVLIVGSSSKSAELVRYTEYDYTTYPIMQPIISTFPADVSNNTVYSLTGLRFKGTSESSSGIFGMNSPTNYPRVYLRYMDSGNYGFMGPSGRLIDVTTSEYPMTKTQWESADTSISFRTPSDLQPGYYLLTVMANAIPSDAKIIRYLVLPPYITKIGAADGWQWQEVQGGDTVSSGSPEGWLWRPSLLGSGRKVPRGTAPLWNWTNE